MVTNLTEKQKAQTHQLAFWSKALGSASEEAIMAKALLPEGHEDAKTARIRVHSLIDKIIDLRADMAGEHLGKEGKKPDLSVVKMFEKEDDDE